MNKVDKHAIIVVFNTDIPQNVLKLFHNGRREKMAGILAKGNEGVKVPRPKNERRIEKGIRGVPAGNRSQKPEPPRPLPRSGR